jgi:hypothetical protein
MAKQFTPDILEAMLTRLTDKFMDMFKLLIEQMTTIVNTRIDKIEAKFADLCDQISRMETRAADASASTVAAVAAVPLVSGNTTNEQLSAFKTLLAVDTEMADRARRACNVIISGLPVCESVDDADAFLGSATNT